MAQFERFLLQLVVEALCKCTVQQTVEELPTSYPKTQTECSRY